MHSDKFVKNFVILERQNKYTDKHISYFVVLKSPNYSKNAKWQTSRVLIMRILDTLACIFLSLFSIPNKFQTQETHGNQGFNLYLLHLFFLLYFRLQPFDLIIQFGPQTLLIALLITRCSHCRGPMRRSLPFLANTEGSIFLLVFSHAYNSSDVRNSSTVHSACLVAIVTKRSWDFARKRECRFRNREKQPKIASAIVALLVRLVMRTFLHAILTSR